MKRLRGLPCPVLPQESSALRSNQQVKKSTIDFNRAFTEEILKYWKKGKNAGNFIVSILPFSTNINQINF
jgi:hypothetical protein